MWNSLKLGAFLDKQLKPKPKKFFLNLFFALTPRLNLQENSAPCVKPAADTAANTTTLT